MTVRDADRFYGEPLARFDAMANSTSDDPVDAAHFKMWCRIASDEIRHARELQGEVAGALREANAFILAPAEDLREHVLSRIRAALAARQPEGKT